MKIDELTYGQMKEIAAAVGGNASPAPAGHAYEIGQNYLIRTVTYAQTGKLVAVCDKELVIADAAWIADTGRFADAVLSCDFEEVEPFPPGRRVIVNRAAIIDVTPIDTLPMKQQ